jgi:hypothetical protein
LNPPKLGTPFLREYFPITDVYSAQSPDVCMHTSTSSLELGPQEHTKEAEQSK